jgi:hypothetical protein
MVALGCRLSITPSPDALCEAARCHSVAAVQQLLLRIYGEQGLVTAFELGGREKPDNVVGIVEGVNGVTATPDPPDLLSPEVLRSLPLQVARFFLHQPRTPPRWRTSRPPGDRDDGSWVGG